jgi:hypothetical protein
VLGVRVGAGVELGLAAVGGVVVFHVVKRIHFGWGLRTEGFSYWQIVAVSDGSVWARRMSVERWRRCELLAVVVMMQRCLVS